MSRRDWLLSIPAVVVAAGVSNCAEPERCRTCNGVGIVTLPTSRWHTVTMHCPTECYKPKVA